MGSCEPHHVAQVSKMTPGAVDKTSTFLRVCLLLALWWPKSLFTGVLMARGAV